MKTVRMVSTSPTPRGIKVYNAESGEEMRGINYIEILPLRVNDIIKANVRFVMPEFDIIAQTTEIEVSPEAYLADELGPLTDYIDNEIPAKQQWFCRSEDKNA